MWEAGVSRARYKLSAVVFAFEITYTCVAAATNIEHFFVLKRRNNMKSIALIIYEWQAVSNYGELYRLFNTLHMLTTEEHQNWPLLPHRDWNTPVTVGVAYFLQKR